MFPFLNIGPLAVPTVPIVYLLGAYLALSVVERAAKQRRLNYVNIYSTAATSLFLGLVGARLAFVGLHWAGYQSDLLGIVWPLTNGFSRWGGLFVGLLVLALLMRVRQHPLGSTLDALAPGLCLGLLALSLADFLAGPGLGNPTSLPWGINIFETTRHPVQIYEMIFAAVGFLVGWLIVDGKSEGKVFLQAMVVLSFGRLFTEAFRANSTIVGDGYRLIQLIAFIVLLLSLTLLLRPAQNANWHHHPE